LCCAHRRGVRGSATRDCSCLGASRRVSRLTGFHLHRRPYRVAQCLRDTLQTLALRLRRLRLLLRLRATNRLRQNLRRCQTIRCPRQRCVLEAVLEAPLLQLQRRRPRLLPCRVGLSRSARARRGWLVFVSWAGRVFVGRAGRQLGSPKWRTPARTASAALAAPLHPAAPGVRAIRTINRIKPKLPQGECVSQAHCAAPKAYSRWPCTHPHGCQRCQQCRDVFGWAHSGWVDHCTRARTSL
jgi:hypothetical protein